MFCIHEYLENVANLFVKFTNKNRFLILKVQFEIEYLKLKVEYYY